MFAFVHCTGIPTVDEIESVLLKDNIPSSSYLLIPNRLICYSIDRSHNDSFVVGDAITRNEQKLGVEYELYAPKSLDMTNFDVETTGQGIYATAGYTTQLNYEMKLTDGNISFIAESVMERYRVLAKLNQIESALIKKTIAELNDSCLQLKSRLSSLKLWTVYGIERVRNLMQMVSNPKS